MCGSAPRENGYSCTSDIPEALYLSHERAIRAPADVVLVRGGPVVPRGRYIHMDACCIDRTCAAPRTHVTASCGRARSATSNVQIMPGRGRAARLADANKHDVPGSGEGTGGEGGEGRNRQRGCTNCTRALNGLVAVVVTIGHLHREGKASGDTAGHAGWWRRKSGGSKR